MHIAVAILRRQHETYLDQSLPASRLVLIEEGIAPSVLSQPTRAQSVTTEFLNEQ